jgi:hypothetical protein
MMCSCVIPAENPSTVVPEQCSKALFKDGNGTSPDIADIALQQLLDREVQDS